MASASSLPSNDQRQDLESLLECSICLETFDNPRTLLCLHSFCKKCLENFVDGKRENELTCPVCRTKFTKNEEGVSGMTRNHFICNMVEVLSIQHQDKCIPCSHCEQASVGRCVTCELFMCETCLQSHNGYIGFRDHTVLTMAELSKPENRSKIKGKSYCKKHSSKKLKLYCETCEELVCTYCVVVEHVRPDHVCSPLEEVAEQKREELKAICTALKSNENSTERYYNELTKSSLHLNKDLDEAKRNILQKKNSVFKLAEDALEKKAQTLMRETEEIVQEKKQTIGEELRRVSDHKAGQTKTYDMAKALADNGSNEEIVLSHNLVKQSVEDAAGGCESKGIYDKLPQQKNRQLYIHNMFLDEIKTLKGNNGILQRTSYVGYEIQESLRNAESAKSIFTLSASTGRWSEPRRNKLVFDPLTGKLVPAILSDQQRNSDMIVAVDMAISGFGPCEPVHE